MNVDAPIHHGVVRHPLRTMRRPGSGGGIFNDFKSMQANQLQLSDLLRVNENEGTLHFRNRRMLVFDADALGLLRKELIESFGFERARRLLTRFGWARGYRDALTARDLSENLSIEAWREFAWRFVTLAGNGHILPHRFDVDRDRGVFEIESEIKNSYEAEQHLLHLGLSTCPACWTLTGYATAFGSMIFGQGVIYYEKECVAKGDVRCLVEGKIADLSDPELKVHIEPYASIGLDSEERRLLDELEQRSKDLQRQTDKLTALESQVLYLQEELRQSQHVNEMIGVSPAFQKTVRDIETVAASDLTVLILGETGTGKELIARALHARSQRSRQPLINVNCASLPAGLVESELFGHEKGAFTGAIQRKLGRFELANHATIFLDELGELPLDTQAKLLRVLQQGELERLGGAQTIRVNVRVIAATNQPLEKLVAENKFRADLFYRLNVYPIHLPPLRERIADIVPLAQFFTQKFRTRLRRPIKSIAQESLRRMEQYPWPGNIRELEHTIERAVLLCQTDTLHVDLPTAATASVTAAEAAEELVSLDENTRRYLQRVLRQTNGMVEGRGGAAEILGLPASTLRSKMKKLGISLVREIKS